GVANLVERIRIEIVDDVLKLVLVESVDLDVLAAEILDRPVDEIGDDGRHADQKRVRSHLSVLAELGHLLHESPLLAGVKSAPKRDRVAVRDVDRPRLMPDEPIDSFHAAPSLMKVSELFRPSGSNLRAWFPR